ncbi:MAG: restriction endonuclease subunit S [Synechococcaceae cyanobacterium]
MEERRELPVGWCWSELIDACSRIVDGSHNPPKASDFGLPMLSARNIENRRVNLNAEHRLIGFSDFELENRRTSVESGDVLLTIVGAIGRTAEVEAEFLPFTLQRSVAVMKPADGFVSKYLCYALESPEFQQFLVENAKGTAQKGIYLKALGKASIPVAPTGEQRRIAAKLHTTLAAVDACRQRLDGVETLLKRFRQAVLAAATSGGLTREWREERGRDLAPWADKTVGDLVSDIDAGLNLKCDERPPEGDERGLVKISAVTWGTYNEEESKTLNQDAIISEENRIRPGDFLISRANTIELVGACVIVHQVTRKLYLSDKVLRLVVPEECKPWLLLCLRSPSGRRQIEGLSSGNQLSMRNLAQKNLLAIKIRMPPPDELDAIKRGAQQLFSLADQLEVRLSAARKIVERLTPALLAKAFRGELVPQDPGDEPASALLERLAAKKRAARQAEAAASGPSRPGRRQAAANPEPSMFDAAPVPPDRLANLLRECGALSERALLAASELDPAGFRAQLALERELGTIQATLEDGQVLLEAVG